MKRDYEHCFTHMGETEESAAECIHCLKKHGEQVLFDDEKKRLILGREMFDTEYSDRMKSLSGILGISTREEYEAMDRKYNLTMY